MKTLLIRTLSGLVFLAIMVAGITIHPLAFGALAVVVMAVGLNEFFRFSIGTRFIFAQKMALLAAVTFLTLNIGVEGYGLPSGWLSLTLLPLILIPISCIFLSSFEEINKIAYVFTALLYIALPIGLSPKLCFHDGLFDGSLLLSLFIIIWASDTGAYVIGTAFGQRPNCRRLAPVISPKKSWWGFWGSIVFGVIAGLVLSEIGYLQFSILHACVLGLIISVGATFGDLFESLWKRHFGIKDSGDFIPGHGGILDRFDSSLVAIPLASVYIVIIQLIQ